MISLSQLVWAFARIGLLSFGGPAAQIVVMHDTLVKDRKWLTEAEFLRALSFCMMLPGPEAMQLCTYAGWRLRGTLGGVIAGVLFVLPGALVVGALTAGYLRFGALPDVQAAFLGVKAAVLVIVALALRRLAAKTLNGTMARLLAFGAFSGLFFFQIPFPVILAVAAGVGAIWSAPQVTHSDPPAAVPLRDTAKRIAVWGAVWIVPLAAVTLAFPQTVLPDIAVFFSWLAVITFGGAYAVLAYMAQVAVEGQGWLTAAQMVDGLGLAETTPGPLILVTLFVGIMAGAQTWGMGLAAGLVTLWATFAPCFLWIFAGAPYIERLAHATRLQGALAGVSAAVVGVIANLSLWFALNVLFEGGARVQWGLIRVWAPDMAAFIPQALVLAGFAAALMAWRGWGLARALPACALAGWVFGALMGGASA